MSDWLLEVHIVAILSGLMLLVSERLHKNKTTTVCMGIWFLVSAAVTIMRMTGLVQ